MSQPAAVPRSVPRSSSAADQQWIGRLRTAVEQAGSAMWTIGDLMQSAPGGVEGATCAEIAARTGATAGMLRTAKWLARRFPAAQRHADLGPSHHIEVAALPDELALPLLDRAAGDGAAEDRWTVMQLRAEARAEAAEAGIKALLDRGAAQDPASADFSHESRRAERVIDQSAMEVAARLRSADAVVEALARHPGRGSTHGNRRNAIVERLRASFAALEGELQAFLARSTERLAHLEAPCA